MEIHDARNVAIGTILAAIATDPEHPLREGVFAWMRLAPGREAGELREHPTRYLPNWKSAGPRVIQRILAASDSQLALKARLRYGTATAEPAVPSLSESDIAVRASRRPDHGQSALPQRPGGSAGLDVDPQPPGLDRPGPG